MGICCGLPKTAEVRTISSWRVSGVPKIEAVNPILPLEVENISAICAGFYTMYKHARDRSEEKGQLDTFALWNRLLSCDNALTPKL
jgi:hypothetical protein